MFRTVLMLGALALVPAAAQAQSCLALPIPRGAAGPAWTMSCTPPLASGAGGLLGGLARGMIAGQQLRLLRLQQQLLEQQLLEERAPCVLSAGGGVYCPPVAGEDDSGQ